MSYNETLKGYAINEFRYLHREVMNLLNIDTEAEYNENIEYFYYKNPFNNEENTMERELIVFTKNCLIIEVKPVYDENNKFYKIDISVLRIKDIKQIDFNTNQNDYDTDKNLAIRFNDFNVIELKSMDICSNWKYDTSMQIKEIAKFLLKKML